MDAQQHTELQARLREEGLAPFVYHSGGGNIHTAVMLVDENGEQTPAQLFIATGDANAEIEVGLMGWDVIGNCEGEFEPVENVEAAVARFKMFWEGRSRYITGWILGNYDV